MRQGQLSEPTASSGPAAMLLADSRSPSSIPRRSPCPERCHLPLASFDYIRLSKPQINPRLHPLPMRCHLPLASLNHIHLSKPQKHPRLHPLPERCLLPLASLNHIHLTKPQTYPRLPPMLRADVKKNLSHRHETPAFSSPGLPKKNKMYYTY